MERQRFVHALALVAGGLVFAAAPGGASTHVAAKPAIATRAAVLPFIEDDYEGALAIARSRHLPLFIESWAPW
jgi:hypothetical protein